jgi:hypothetical protein
MAPQVPIICSRAADDPARLLSKRPTLAAAIGMVRPSCDPCQNGKLGGAPTMMVPRESSLPRPRAHRAPVGPERRTP